VFVLQGVLRGLESSARFLCMLFSCSLPLTAMCAAVCVAMCAAVQCAMKGVQTGEFVKFSVSLIFWLIMSLYDTLSRR